MGFNYRRGVWGNFWDYCEQDLQRRRGAGRFYVVRFAGRGGGGIGALLTPGGRVRGGYRAGAARDLGGQRCDVTTPRSISDYAHPGPTSSDLQIE